MRMNKVRQLLDASEQGDILTVNLLLDDGVNVDLCDDENITSLHTASANSHENIVRLLVAHRASLEKRNQYGWTALMFAAYYGHLSIVQLLLQSRAVVNPQNSVGATPLICACRSGHLCVVRVLLDSGAEVNISPEAGCLNPVSPLMTAAQHGHEQVVKILLEYGAEVNYKQGINGWSALMLAALNGHLSVVQLLVENDAALDDTNIAGQTALEISRLRRRIEVENYLCKFTTEQPRDQGIKPLRPSIIEAAKNGDFDCVREILEDETNESNTMDDDGATPLMFAAWKGHQDIAKLLLDYGADVDCQDRVNGWTALMQATFHKHRSIVTMLISGGANVNIRAKNGCTAFDMASIVGDTDVVRLLGASSMPTGESKSSLTSKFLEKDLEPIDSSKTGIKTWLSKMSSRFRQLNFGFTLRMNSSTKLEPLDGQNLKDRMQMNHHHHTNYSNIGHSCAHSGSVATINSLKSVDSVLSIKSSDRSKALSALSIGSPSFNLPEEMIAPIIPPSIPLPAFELPRKQKNSARSSTGSLSSSPQSSISSPSRKSSFAQCDTSPDSSQNSSGFYSASNNSGNRKSISPMAMALRRRSKVGISPSPSPTYMMPLASSPTSQFQQMSKVNMSNCMSPLSRSRTLTPETASTLTLKSRHPAAPSGFESGEDEVSNLLKKLSLQKYQPIFEEQEVDMEAFLTLEDEDLKVLGITQKDVRQQIISAINKLNTGKDKERQSYQDSLSSSLDSKNSRFSYDTGTFAPESMSLASWSYRPAVR